MSIMGIRRARARNVPITGAAFKMYKEQVESGVKPELEPETLAFYEHEHHLELPAELDILARDLRSELDTCFTPCMIRNPQIDLITDETVGVMLSEGFAMQEVVCQ